MHNQIYWKVIHKMFKAQQAMRNPFSIFQNKTSPRYFEFVSSFYYFFIIRYSRAATFKDENDCWFVLCRWVTPPATRFAQKDRPGKADCRARNQMINFLSKKMWDFEIIILSSLTHTVVKFIKINLKYFIFLCSIIN